MASPLFRFGPFLVDGAGYRVSRDGQPVDLTPKLLDLLLHLLERAGTLVTKESLLDALWPDANVTENALAQAVSELRQLLGDDAGDPRFIKTVARRGYRFIGDVERLDRTAETAPGGTDRVAVTTETPDSARTLAVVDFTNVSGDSDSAWLSAGIPETVTGDIRALGHFRVVDRWRVAEAARRTNGSLLEMMADLQARLAVVGTFQRQGDRIRISARLVDVSSGEAKADAKVDGPIAQIFELQDQIAVLLARDLGLQVEPPVVARLAVRETSSLEAFRACTEGNLRLETLDTREMSNAIADFERAVAADSRYALAFTGLATAEYAGYESTRNNNEPDRALLDRAVAHARRAVELDSGVAEAHATLALVLVSAACGQEAAAAARRAVALEPSNWRHLFRLSHATWGEARLRAATATLALYPEFAFAHFQMAMVYVARGHLAQAETILREGADVQDRQIGGRSRYPALGLHWLLGLVCLSQGRTEQAIAEFDRELALADPNRLYGHEYALHSIHARGLAHLAARNYDAALAEFERALTLDAGHADSHLGSSFAYRATGKTERASASLTRVKEILGVLERTHPVHGPLTRAHLLIAEGDPSEATGTLNALLAEAPPGFAAWSLPVDPLLLQLANSDGFRDVLRRLRERAG